ncbi:hypothetical protein [Streptomyces sp. NPDC050485]|uniref:hypothetical protein n=1 Tax=Streptomyces sp. NPDC050485 TaxID=3365617 RepID=UPI0037BE07F1
MGKGTTKGSVQWYKIDAEGRYRCYHGECLELATRWIDMERYGNRRWLSTSYCDDHGDWALRDPGNPHHVRPIKG